MGQIFIIETIPDQKQIDQMLLLVSKERQERIQSTRSFSEFSGLLGEALVLAIACKKAKCEIGKIHFLRSDDGKPYIPELPMFHFNISHTNHILAIAISKHPIGVDIEQIKLADLRIAKRFFSKEEQKYIFSCPEKINIRFYEIWTKKEAYVKYIGCGFRRPLVNINVCDSKITAHMLTYVTSKCCISIFRHDTNERFEFCQLSDNAISWIEEVVTKIQ